MKTLWVVGSVLLASQAVKAAQIYVSPIVPSNVGPGFMGRIQSESLREAIAHRGELAQVATGPHTIRVPCDGELKGQFATVTLTLSDSKPMAIEFVNCGIAFIEAPRPTLSAAVKL